MDFLGIVTIPNWLLFLFILLIGIYVYNTWTFDYFKKRGIKGPKPYPFIGTGGALFTEGINESLKRRVKEYGSVVGSFQGRTPELLISDVDMMKQILVKEFHTFVDRRKLTCRGIMKESVFDLTGNDWKRVRSLLTPSFSSGKMRQMDPSINICATAFLKGFDDIVKNGGEFEAKKYTEGYTMDVIASTAFGLQVDSQTDRDNDFVIYAHKFFKFSITSFIFIIVFFASFLSPVVEYFGISMFPHDSSQFFRQTINSAVEQRQQSGEKRADLLQSMMNAHNEVEESKEILQSSIKKGLTNEEIIAQSVLFFLAGYETTANTMAFFLYNMATHPDVQEKVVQEVEENIRQHGQPCYDNISKMTYLDMCISETLRLYPPIPVVDRSANKDITINGVHIPAGMLVLIPIIALHRNPDAWPEPERFDPERFTPEAKSLRDPFYFLPFGLGPRQCIGMRLAQMEMKIALSRLLQQFRILPCEKTEIPIKIRKFSGTTVAENGIHLKVEVR